MKTPFSLPKPPEQQFPSAEEFAALKRAGFDLAEKVALLRSELDAANRTIGRLRDGDRSPFERILLREREELLEQNALLDERNAGLRLENEQLTRERDDAMAHVARYLAGAS